METKLNFFIVFQIQILLQYEYTNCIVIFLVIIIFILTIIVCIVM